MKKKVINPYIYQDSSSHIIKIAAEKAGVPFDIGQKMLDDYYRSVRFILDDERMPTIMIPYLGTLRASQSKIDRIIRHKIAQARLGTKNAIIYLKYVWAKYRPIRHRIFLEKQYRGDKRSKFVYNQWRYVPRNWFRHVYPELFKEVRAIDYSNKGKYREDFD